MAGSDQVLTKFNPSQNPAVAEIKSKAAELIDLCEDMKIRSLGGRAGRWASLAATAFEEGAMWAVKAATNPD